MKMKAFSKPFVSGYKSRKYRNERNIYQVTWSTTEHSRKLLASTAKQKDKSTALYTHINTLSKHPELLVIII